MAKILLTGATGLVGKYFVEHTEHDVFSVTRDVADLSKSFKPQKFPQKIDIVIHLAQSRHYKHFPAAAHDIFAVNTNATAQLLQYAYRANASQFIYASTGGVYRTGFGLNEGDDLPFPLRDF
jgi:UDP-glucose 4-epimerase